MKKLMKLLLILGISTQLTVNAANAGALSGDISSEHIPAGTVISVKTSEFVDSLKATSRDRFDVVTMTDIVANNKMLLPKGTIIRGSVNKVNHKKILSKDASVYVKFDHLVSPAGTQIPVSLAIHSIGILTPDGALGYGGNYGTASKQNVKNAGKIITNMTKWGITTGDKAWNGWPKFILTPISSVVSVPCAGLYLIADEIVDIFKYGNDIALNQGEVINLMFTKGVDIPTY